MILLGVKYRSVAWVVFLQKRMWVFICSLRSTSHPTRLIQIVSAECVNTSSSVINSTFVCMCVCVEMGDVPSACEWWLIRSGTLIFHMALHLKLTEAPVVVRSHKHMHTWRQMLTLIDQRWRCSYHFHSSPGLPGSCYRFHFTVCLIHSLHFQHLSQCSSTMQHHSWLSSVWLTVAASLLWS